MLLWIHPGWEPSTVSCYFLLGAQWHTHYWKWLDGMSLRLRDGASIVVGLLVPLDLRPWSQIPIYMWLTIIQEFLYSHRTVKTLLKEWSMGIWWEDSPAQVLISQTLKSIHFHLDTNSWGQKFILLVCQQRMWMCMFECVWQTEADHIHTHTYTGTSRSKACLSVVGRAIIWVEQLIVLIWTFHFT